MNAVVYARFSSHRQGEQSIEGQVAEAERFAQSHDLTIIHVYADRAQTGRNDNREQFQQMLSDAAKHAFDALIVWKTDRIGRNKEEIALNKYHLKKNGVKIFYVAEAIPDTPEGIILEAVIEGMAAYYSEQLSQNVRRGMKNSAQKGRYTGGTCPLGYIITADKKYEVDPKYAPVVRDIFQLYSEGKTITEIVNILNDRGLRTSRGHPFTHNSLRTVLKNKKYIGTYEYNGEVTIENSVPPIVDVDVFNKVQELLEYNQKAAGHKKAKVDYMLFGKLFCGKCGAMMTGVCGTSKQKVKHHYYICSAKKKKLCTKRAVRQDWIEPLVLKHLLKLVKNEELLEFIAENTYQYFLAQNTDTTYTKSLQKALDETEKSIANLLKAIEAGIFNESTKERMNELEEQKKDLGLALAAAKLKEDLALKKEHIVFFLHQFAEMDYSDIECQKRLIKIFLNSVFVYDDKVVLTFNYSGDSRTITLHEIDGGLGHSIRIPRAFVHQKKNHPSGWFFFLSKGRSGIHFMGVTPSPFLFSQKHLHFLKISAIICLSAFRDFCIKHGRLLFYLEGMAMKKPVLHTEIAYFLGLFLLAWGTALTAWGGYGISMVVAPAYILHIAMSQHLPWFTFGVAEYILQAFILSIMMLLLRKFKFSFLLSFAATVIYGVMLDCGMALFNNILPASPLEWQSILAYIGGDFAVCAGVALIFRAYLPPEAYELFVKEISPRIGLKIHIFKIVYDCSSLVVALLMSFALLGRLQGIDIGTIFCAIINGMLIKLFSNLYDRTLEFKDAFPLRKRFEESEEKL